MSNVNWKDYTIAHSTEGKEKTGWSVSESFGKAEDQKRLMMIGDSICNGYQRVIKERIAGKANFCYWVSSKCVTDELFLPELDQKLDMMDYNVITYNNGLHSLKTVRSEYDEAYEKSVDFIMAKCPNAKLFLVLSTPSTDPKLSAISSSLNETVRRVAKARNLPVIDLFALMDPLDRDQNWRDIYHYKPEAIELQADKLLEVLEPVLFEK